MKIVSKIKEYEVIFEDSPSFISSLLAIEHSYFVISRTVFRLYNQLFASIDKERLLILEGKEENKTIEIALSICDKITNISAKRNTTLISIGGGTIQDITGFVASIMYRGINWIYVPTTLLSACDSCIGGKSSLNYHRYKNLLGTFYPPDKIYIWPGFFNTLSDKDYKSGLGEVTKFSIMSGLDGLDEIEKHFKYLINKEPNIVKRFVNTSLEYKKSFIELDEFDKGERIKLNFAHTFGHSIEVVTDYKIPHGTAVAIGMIMADYISYKRGYINETVKERSEKLLLQIIDIDINLFLNNQFESFLAAIKKDKKQIGDSLTAVLITRFDKTGELSIVHDVSQNEIRDAIEYFENLYIGKTVL